MHDITPLVKASEGILLDFQENDQSDAIDTDKVIQEVLKGPQKCVQAMGTQIMLECNTDTQRESLFEALNNLRESFLTLSHF